MRTKDLIEQLQKLVDDHKPCEWLMGEHEIMIDVFQVTEMECKEGIMYKSFKYLGFSPEIFIDKSGDGVYDILSGFAR